MVTMLQHDTDALSFAVASGIWRILEISPDEKLPERPSAESIEHLRAFLVRQRIRATDELEATNRRNAVRLNGEMERWNLLRAAYTFMQSEAISELGWEGDDINDEKRRAQTAMGRLMPSSPLLPPLDTIKLSALVGVLATMVAALDADEWNRFDLLASEFCANARAQCIFRRMELPDLADHIYRMLDVPAGNTCPRPQNVMLVLLEFVVATQILIEGYALSEQARLASAKADFANLGVCVQALAPPRFRRGMGTDFILAFGQAREGTVAQTKLDSPLLARLTALLEQLRRTMQDDQVAWSEFNNELESLTMMY
ncbi:MAG: hypothetical protein QM756_16515 [Polyangiaceae bacterium]